MKKNSITASDIHYALMNKFCNKCDDGGGANCDGCIVSSAGNAVAVHERIQREKKNAETNTLLRTG